jgi:hypothetical protein
MMIIMHPGASRQQVKDVVTCIEGHGLSPHLIEGVELQPGRFFDPARGRERHAHFPSLQAGFARVQGRGLDLSLGRVLGWRERHRNYCRTLLGRDP